ncbi:MAG: hypothetical protein R3B57_07945 [Phycisphaerales bacterium]
MPEGTPRQRICRICGQDCSDRPRVKDAKGRYYCRACAESVAARKKTAPPPPPDPEPLDLSLDEPDDIAIEPEVEPPRRAAGLCPFCARPLAPDTGRCPGCGYDPAQGLESSQRVRTPRGAKKPAIACHNCGYDMSSLRTLKCPECGALRPPPSAKGPDKPDRPVLDALKAPAICFVVGMLGITAVGIISGEPLLPLVYLVLYLVVLPVGLLVFYVCCYLWIGFDAPFYLNAAALLGTYAIADLVGAVTSPLGFLGWVLQLLVYVGVLSKLLDIELVDAILVALITGIVKFVIVFILVMTFTPYFLGSKF